MSALFQREPVTLDDFTPRFTRDECLFGYRLTRTEIGGGFKSMEEPRPGWSHDINVRGVHLRETTEDWDSRDRYRMVVEMVNGLLSSKDPSYAETAEWVLENAKDLNTSRRYWMAMDHKAQIDKTKAEIAELQEQVRRAGFVQSLYALEVKEGRAINGEERKRVLAEFAGSEDEFGNS